MRKLPFANKKVILKALVSVLVCTLPVGSLFSIVQKESGILLGQMRAVANDDSAEVTENPAYLSAGNEKKTWSAALRQAAAMSVSEEVGTGSVNSAELMVLGGDVSFSYNNLLNKRLTLGMAFSSNPGLDYYSSLKIDMLVNSAQVTTSQKGFSAGLGMAASYKLTDSDFIGVKISGLQRKSSSEENVNLNINNGTTVGTYMKNGNEKATTDSGNIGFGYLFRDTDGELGFLIEGVGVQRNTQEGELNETTTLVSPISFSQVLGFKTNINETLWNDVVFRFGISQYFTENIKGYLEAAVSYPATQEVRKYKLDNSQLLSYKGTRTSEPALFLSAGLAWQLNPKISLLGGFGYTTLNQTKKYATTTGTSASLTEEAKTTFLNMQTGIIYQTENLNYQGGLGYSLTKISSDETKYITKSESSSFSAEFHSLTVYFSVHYDKL